MRGGSDADMGSLEDDQLQEHQHIDNGHQHGCTASSNSQPHSHSQLFAKEFLRSVRSDFYGTQVNYGSTSRATSSVTVTVTTSCNVMTQTASIGGVNSATGARSGTETRPKNMNVIYIMRVW